MPLACTMGWSNIPRFPGNPAPGNMFGDGDIPEETENGGAFAGLPEKTNEPGQG